MKAVLLAVAAGCCWGVGELCTKMVLHTHRIGPITAIAVRSTIALPLLWVAYLLAVPLLGAEPRGWWSALTGADRARLILGSGLVAGGAAMILYYAALNLDDISRIKPIAFTIAPAVAAILGWRLLGEAMTPRKGMAIALILAGVLLLTGEKSRHAAAATPEGGAAVKGQAPPAP